MAMDIIEIQGVASDRNDVFPYSGMRILGFIQLINGALIFILGVVDLVTTMLTYEEDKKRLGSDYDIIVNMTLASTALWCGTWFGVTGSLGTCISRAKAHTLQFFKIAFLVLNILCATLFGPICAVVNGVIAISRHTLSSNDFQWMVTMLICFLALLEIVMAIATASVTCCCSPLRGTQVHVMINSNKERGDSNNEKLNQSYQENDVSYISGKSQDDAIQSGPPSKTHRNDDAAVRASMESRQVQAPATHKFDGFADSNPVYGSYTKLKKWALPQW